MTLSPHAARVRRMFSDIAPRYDLLNHLMSLQIDRRWRRRAVRASVRPTDHSLLDLCCGSGDLALAFAKAMAPGARVVGSDFAHPMLVNFDTKLKRGAPERPPHLVEADSMRIPFPSETFDLVSVGFGLRNLDDPGAGLREMARVARPGGRIIVLDFCPHERPRVHQRLFDWTFRRVITPIAGRISGHPEAYAYLPQSVGRFPTRQELGRLMEQAGLRVIVSRGLTGGVAALVVGEKS